MRMAASAHQQRFEGNGDTVQIDLRTVFRDLLPIFETIQPSLALRAAGRLAIRLSSAWPDLRLGADRTALIAAEVDRIPTHASGLAFRTGLLRPPRLGPGPWASSTIPLSWKGEVRCAGLGERLITGSDAGLAAARGNEVAATVMADRLGGPAYMLPKLAERALIGGKVLVEGDNAGRDIASLCRLLQAHAAAKLTVLARKQGSRLARAARQAGAALLLLDDTSPWAVVDAADEVHAPLHHDIAVLARMAGRPVFDCGVRAADCAPGLLAAAFLVLGTRYLDPSDGRPIACEAFLDRVLEWRRLQARVPRIGCFVGISFWKRRRMAEFAGGKARFARGASQAVALAAQAQGGIAVWPSRAPEGLDAAAAAAGVPVFRVEDGFIRSRGLGADFIPPASIIMDGRGIYYDARQPSDLEVLLTGQTFTPELLSRARRLIDVLVARGITKYNLGGTRPAVAFPAERRRILVPGQVADDLSVRVGGAGVAPGLPLLTEVRRRNPDAFVIYKPHPDVEAGHRRGAVPDAEVLRSADLVVRDVAMDSLIGEIDEVHTVTSLTGFEALLRLRPVTTYGRPFYAGWGLTTDIHSPAGRGRQLTLEELVAATLILYPHYLDPVTRLPCGPEQLIGRLDKAGDWRTGTLVGLRRGQGALRRGLARRMAGLAL